jgi:regulator of sirC expression with transglutaminase-like and TPR domain
VSPDNPRDRFAAVVRAADVDLAEAALLMGVEVDAEFDPAEGIAELERLAAAVRARVGPAFDPGKAAAALALVLGGRARFFGRESDYADLRSSLLHEVLRRRRGLPILLSMVWIDVGRRAGLPVYGVALPGHFVVGIGDPDGEFELADPFHGGVPLSVSRARELAAAAGGHPGDPALLQPARPTAILLRVLNNIRAWAAQPERGIEGAWTRLWAVELSLLLPRHPAALRHERGSLLARTGEFAAGARQLDEYADLVARIDPKVAEAARGEAKAARARLN